VTSNAVESSDPDDVEATDDDRFELRVVLDATDHSLGAHGRALASLLLALHGWLDTQEAESVEVTLDGRTFTLRGREAG
jgi:hypothetical protein